jgi:hypothetical protein
MQIGARVAPTRFMKSASWLVIVGWLAGCSSAQIANDAGDGAAGDTAAGDTPTSDHDTGDRDTGDGHVGDGDAAKPDTSVDCGSADANNDPQCPPRYMGLGCGQVCSTPGLRCAYPGVGDGPDSQGCFATAVAWCMVPPGADGGGTIWVCAQ